MATAQLKTVPFSKYIPFSDSANTFDLTGVELYNISRLFALSGSIGSLGIEQDLTAPSGRFSDNLEVDGIMLVNIIDQSNGAFSVDSCGNVGAESVDVGSGAVSAASIKTGDIIDYRGEIYKPTYVKIEQEVCGTFTMTSGYIFMT